MYVSLKVYEPISHAVWNGNKKGMGENHSRLSLHSGLRIASRPRISNAASPRQVNYIYHY